MTLSVMETYLLKDMAYRKKNPRRKKVFFTPSSFWDLTDQSHEAILWADQES